MTKRIADHGGFARPETWAKPNSPKKLCTASVGDKTRVLRETPGNLLVARRYDGEVVYVHPRGRYAVVKLDCGFCEGYWGEELLSQEGGR